jgi:myo-inositol catabolism protein IolC
LELRPQLTAQAIEQLQDAGVDPDVWNIEGLDSQEDCKKIVATARRQGRNGVGCSILVGGGDNGQARRWLTTAAAVPGFIGFAAGRASFGINWWPGERRRQRGLARQPRLPIAIMS